MRPRGTLVARSVTSAAVMLAGATTGVALPLPTAEAAAGGPDIIVIVTDDQRADTLRWMPRTREWLPTRFVNAFVSNAACCPSRTTMFTGSYSHANGVWTNGGGKPGTTRREYGGWRRYAELDLDDRSIAPALQAAGYRTGHFGKFLNLFRASSLEELPVGWDEFLAIANGRRFPKGERSPYYGYSLAGIGPDGYVVETHGEDAADHSTRVVTDDAVGFIERADERPLFLHVAYPTPHARRGGAPPLPQERDEDAVVDLPRLDPNVNEADVSDKPSYIQDADTVRVDQIDRWRTAIARSLIGVDRGIDAILEAQSVRDPGLENTFVMFVSDNGRLHGEHRWVGKSIAYEEAIRIPMLVAWPALAPGIDRRLVGNIDIAATLAEVAGVAFAAPESVSMLGPERNLFILEGVGRDKAYCGVRTDERKYVKYGSGETEYYNLRRDPYELENRSSGRAAKELGRVARSVCAENLPPDWPQGVRY